MQLALQAATLFAGCMICHGELVRLQPAPARLPKFYLAIAAGGALGGAFVTLAAPLAFSDYFEHPLVLCVIAAVAVLLVLRDAKAAPGPLGSRRRPPPWRRSISWAAWVWGSGASLCRSARSSSACAISTAS